MTAGASGPSDPLADAVARLLRQRSEMGGGELFLDQLSRKEALSLLARARVAGSPRSATVPAESRSAGAATPQEARAAGTPPDAGAAATLQKGGAAATRAEGASEPDEAEAVRSGAAGEEAIRTFDYDTLKTVAAKCHRCALSGERKQVVFSDGSPDARLVVVGEAPGAREDESGLPFVGPAGKMLDLLLASIDLSREESVYICNVIKCRPPGNRNPLPGEIEACSPYLRRQIELVAPEAILAVGTFAGQLLSGRTSTLGNLRGDVYSYEGVPLVVTYHPAALLRNRGWVRSTWDDLQLLRQVLEGSGSISLDIE